MVFHQNLQGISESSIASKTGREQEKYLNTTAGNWIQTGSTPPGPTRQILRGSDQKGNKLKLFKKNHFHHAVKFSSVNRIEIQSRTDR